MAVGDYPMYRSGAGNLTVWPATNRCGVCGAYWSGYHQCSSNLMTPVGWKCPVCNAGVAPWKADHCRPKDEP